MSGERTMSAVSPPSGRWHRIVFGTFSWRRVFTSFLLIYLCVMVAGWFLSDFLIFLPPPCSYRAGGPYFRVPVTARESIGMLALTNPAAPYVLLYAHGNGEDIGPDLLDEMQEFRRRGFEVYGFDYRGYGISDGRPGYRRSLEDSEVAYQHLVRDRKIAPERIILYGHSVGAAMVLDLAARHKTGGLVIESAFVTAFRVRTQITLFPLDKFRNTRRVREVHCPVLVMHGEIDDAIPAWHGRELFRLAPEPKQSYWARMANHNNVRISNDAEYWKRIGLFVELMERTQGKPDGGMVGR